MYINRITNGNPSNTQAISQQCSSSYSMLMFPLRALEFSVSFAFASYSNRGRNLTSKGLIKCKNHSEMVFIQLDFYSEKHTSITQLKARSQSQIIDAKIGQRHQKGKRSCVRLLAFLLLFTFSVFFPPILAWRRQPALTRSSRNFLYHPFFFMLRHMLYPSFLPPFISSFPPSFLPSFH